MTDLFHEREDSEMMDREYVPSVTLGYFCHSLAPFTRFDISFKNVCSCYDSLKTIFGVFSPVFAYSPVYTGYA